MNDKLRPGYEKYVQKELKDVWRLGEVVESYTPSTTISQRYYTVPKDIVDILEVVEGCLKAVESLKNDTSEDKRGSGRGKGTHENIRRNWEAIFGKYYNKLLELKSILDSIKSNFNSKIPFKELVKFCKAWNAMIDLIEEKSTIYSSINIASWDDTKESLNEFKKACMKKFSELTSPLRNEKYKSFVKCLNKNANKDGNIYECKVI